MSNVRKLTCIVCPRGCEMEVTLGDGGEVISVSGNACKRGSVYANDECTHPRRTVTSTVRLEDGAPLAVKTSSTVPKEKIFEVMAEINRAVAKRGTKIGDVIIETDIENKIMKIRPLNGLFDEN